MAEALIFLFASLSVFLILTEVITVNVIYGEGTEIDINFMIFGISLRSGGGSKRKKRKRRFFNRNISFSGAVFNSLISRCEIYIRKLSLDIYASDPAAFALRRGVSILFISSLIAYAKENAKKFISSNITLDFSEHNNSEVKLDAMVKISLIGIIIGLSEAFIQWLTGTRSNYGRKQNE